MTDSVQDDHEKLTEQSSDTDALDLYEHHTHAFVVKIWLEKATKHNNSVVWRGHITHVVSGKRRYIQKLNHINQFIRSYLAEMGVLIDEPQKDKNFLSES